MNLSSYFWYSQSAIPGRICDLILKQGKESKAGLAVTGQQHKDAKGGFRDIKEQPLNQQEMETLKKKRNSQVVWLTELWIYREVQPYIRKANQESGWNFEWGWSEASQFTIYKKDMHYGWHTDSWNEPYKEEGPSKGKIRKLSSIVVLSDPHEYEGGALEFNFKQDDPGKFQKQTVLPKEITPKGSIIVFPSFVWHQVRPVTKGVRYSMPMWHLGAPFK